MKSPLVVPVILSGGSGTRLWPASRALHPKQFLPLTGERTMLQETALRASGPGFAPPLMICNDEHRFILAEQLRMIGVEPAAIILEPVARNTAPAVCVASLRARQGGGDDPLLLVMPSDHVIGDVPAFRTALDAAIPIAADGVLVTFGVRPAGPETGYGYIRMGAAWDGAAGVHQVARFVEKPDLVTARAYLADGGYLWNSGIFLFSAGTYLAALERTAPAMVEACRTALDRAGTDLTFCRLDRDAFTACPADSIDYAVMEKAERVAVVPVEMDWNDVGAWTALWEIGEKDVSGNVTRGDVILHDCRDSYIRSDERLVAVAGLCDIVVVANDDAILVAHRDRAQDIKLIVDRLKREGRSEANRHTTIYRPWGYHRAIDAGDRYQVKRVVVMPGEELSLQRHHHRAEHWVVVQGTAEIRRGNETWLLHENQSTVIPIGDLHRLSNPGKIPLHVIEVRSGSYLYEDDVERFEDKYNAP